MATAARIARWIGIALAALILLLALLLAALQAGPVKRAALDYVIATAAGGGP
ncbi:MAG: hypothetical protein IRY94_13225, partial [Rhodospirillaceae bacterium]|nr:hypothetical protein [Rhodospirillaceae bacterium]